jgi:hypothetical protein
MAFTFRPFLATAAIALITISTCLSSRSVLADMSLSFSEVVESIYDGTGGKFPILAPKALPTSEKLYVKISADPSRYSIEYVYTPNCKSTSCSWGSFNAERRSIFPSADGDETEGITLAKGKKGRFRLFKGMSSNAFVEWKEGGVLYTAQIKNGRKEDVVKLANSAINPH